ncbi:MAG: serine/threonine-protein kinase [Rubrivivax sp.]
MRPRKVVLKPAVAGRPVLRAGEPFAGYTVVRLLGEGATSVVYLAHAPGGAPVALKLMALSDEALATPAKAQPLKDLFAAEAALARRLDHPNIAQVVDAGMLGPWAWLACEAAPGVPLLRYTQPRRLLPAPLVFRLMALVAQALQHAHSRGVVHRDIKPANLIVDLPHLGLKVTDFGLARVHGGFHTGTGVVLGSPAFLAPELLAGAEATPAGDLYALGVTLYQLLTGQLPFEGHSLGELLRSVAQQAAPPLERLRPELDGAASALVAALLSKPATSRPPSAGWVADRLAGLATAPASASSAG